jgi:hypothetical protein
MNKLKIKYEKPTLRQKQKICKPTHRPKIRKDLQSEVARLEPFQVIGRSNIKTEKFTKFVAEPFYKNY